MPTKGRWAAGVAVMAALGAGCGHAERRASEARAGQGLESAYLPVPGAVPGNRYIQFREEDGPARSLLIAVAEGHRSEEFRFPGIPDEPRSFRLYQRSPSLVIGTVAPKVVSDVHPARWGYVFTMNPDTKAVRLAFSSPSCDVSHGVFGDFVEFENGRRRQWTIDPRSGAASHGGWAPSRSSLVRELDLRVQTIQSLRREVDLPLPGGRFVRVLTLDVPLSGLGPPRPGAQLQVVGSDGKPIGDPAKTSIGEGPVDVLASSLDLVRPVVVLAGDRRSDGAYRWVRSWKLDLRSHSLRQPLIPFVAGDGAIWDLSQIKQGRIALKKGSPPPSPAPRPVFDNERQDPPVQARP